ncbi:hypothetical protein [Paractinoplanes atraurantiacus]|uniref:Uncharacterized protein n=1 Tax=Paractinoplanes atraurantiacus TaxID=1036182 RepID=A0A285KRP2_9ACTN|nr:hypothetical protein [Actinoplanes atraurantiacus]SNY74066.1 hypothetical protein SAMN05421748_15012 [Actinoplanes atraurantiacus]
MRTAGMFAELGQTRHPEPVESIADNIGAGPIEDAELVTRYLDNGYVLIDMMDVERDVLDPEQEILSGSSIMTDGDWLWRQDLSYYVRRHHVTLPPELLATIRERRYAIPPVDEERLVALTGDAERLAF